MEWLYLRQAARFVPQQRRGRPVSTSTLNRWIINGIRRRSDGEIVKLVAKRLPGGWATTQQAMDEFFDRLTVVPASPEVQVDRRVHEDARHAAEQLKRFGIEVKQ